MDLSNEERKEFHGALLDAFPSYKKLEMMLSFELGENLRQISDSGDFQYDVFQLIWWAKAKGRLKDLIREAYGHNPGNPKLKRFYQKKELQLLANKIVDFETVTVNRRGEIINRQSKTAQYFTENLPDNITLDMVYIPGGKFMMGTADEEVERLIQKYGKENEKYFRWEQPQHEVTVPAFLMGKYPVTQEQWKAVANLPHLTQKSTESTA